MLLPDNHCESNSNEHNSGNRYHHVPVYLLYWGKILEEELNCTLMSHSSPDCSHLRAVREGRPSETQVSRVTNASRSNVTLICRGHLWMAKWWTQNDIPGGEIKSNFLAY